MGTLIADLDGTIFLWGTNDFLPGALEGLRRFQSKGGQIVFITQRQRAGNEEVVGLLKRYFPESPILFGFGSPRTIINDQGALAINHPQDAAWDYEL